MSEPYSAMAQFPISRSDAVRRADAVFTGIGLGSDGRAPADTEAVGNLDLI